MLPSSTDLNYFIEVSKTGNLSRAAERLGISQPTLTQSMKKLESVLGCSLLIRSRSGVRLTQAGERVLTGSSDLFQRWQTIRKQAQAQESELQGNFRIGCHASVGRYVLPGFFLELSKQAPQIEVSIVTDISRKVLEGIVSCRVDLGFVVNPTRHPDLVLRKIGDDVVTVFEATHGRRGELLFGDPEMHQTQVLLNRLKKSAFNYTRFISCSNLELVQTLTASGAGFGILPARVAHCGGDKKLRAMKSIIGRGAAASIFPVFKDEIYAVYRREVMRMRAGKFLVDLAGRVCEKSRD